MIKTSVIVGGLLFLVCTLTAAGQSDAANLPCSYSGKLLPKRYGRVVRFDSEEMKRRATHKADLGDLLKPTDFKGTAVVDLVIGTSGQVVGVKAVRAWTFRPEKVNDQAVAYLGIEFDLCNISCNQQGVSLSIVRCPL